jgi:hypothetical protein
MASQQQAEPVGLEASDNGKAPENIDIEIPQIPQISQNRVETDLEQGPVVANKDGEVKFILRGITTVYHVLNDGTLSKPQSKIYDDPSEHSALINTGNDTASLNFGDSIETPHRLKITLEEISEPEFGGKSTGRGVAAEITKVFQWEIVDINPEVSSWKLQTQLFKKGWSGELDEVYGYIFGSLGDVAVELEWQKKLREAYDMRQLLALWKSSSMRDNDVFVAQINLQRPNYTAESRPPLQSDKPMALISNAHSVRYGDMSLNTKFWKSFVEVSIRDGTDSKSIG